MLVVSEILHASGVFLALIYSETIFLYGYKFKKNGGIFPPSLLMFGNLNNVTGGKDKCYTY